MSRGHIYHVTGGGNSLKMRNRLNNEDISIEVGRIQKEFNQIEYTEFIDNTFLRLYQGVEQLHVIAGVKQW